MAVLENLGDQFGRGGRTAADEKEMRLDAVLLQDLQQSRCGCPSGTIIDRQHPFPFAQR